MENIKPRRVRICYTIFSQAASRTCFRCSTIEWSRPRTSCNPVLGVVNGDSYLRFLDHKKLLCSRRTCCRAHLSVSMIVKCDDRCGACCLADDVQTAVRGFFLLSGMARAHANHLVHSVTVRWKLVPVNCDQRFLGLLLLHEDDVHLCRFCFRMASLAVHRDTFNMTHFSPTDLLPAMVSR